MAYTGRTGQTREQCRWMVPHPPPGLGHWRCQDDEGHSMDENGHTAPQNAVFDRKAKWVVP